jgi:hypothetical protein
VQNSNVLTTGARISAVGFRTALLPTSECVITNNVPKEYGLISMSANKVLFLQELKSRRPVANC